MASAPVVERRTIPPSVMASCKLVGIGGLEIVRPEDKLKTVLGSCVGIVLYDASRQIAGLAHSILPAGEEPAAELGKFADQAVDHLYGMLTAAGARQERLAAKLVGGARMFGSGTTATLGDRNVEMARKCLAKYRVPIIAEAVGGTMGRRLVLDPRTGEVAVEVIGQSMIKI